MGTLGLETEKGLYLGIDFGTTNSVVSIYNYDDDEVITIPIDGHRILPSVIQFDHVDEENNYLECYFGFQAKEAAIVYPNGTVSSIKRSLGTDEPVKVVIEDKTFIFKPEDVAARLLGFLKEKADEYLREELFINGEFSGCVITVPANSTDKQKARTKEAAIKAGFDEDEVYLRLEPAAAAINYAMQESQDKKVLIYDFGGGTFDACILNIVNEDEEPSISIMSTYGNNRLGGDDIDSIMADIIYDEFLRLTDSKINLFDDNVEGGLSNKKMYRLRLRQVANSAKERLSEANTTKVVLSPFIQEPEIVNINLEISREMFESHKRIHQLWDTEENYLKFKGKSLKDLINETLFCVEKCIDGAGIKADEVDEIFLVGGSASIPLVRELIRERFHKEPFLSKISPAYSISNGAAHYGKLINTKTGNKIKINEKTIHPIGLEIAGRRFLRIVEAGLIIPEEGLIVESDEPLETNFDNLTSMPIVVYEDIIPDKEGLKFVYEEGMKRLSGTTLRGIPANNKGVEKVKVIFKINQENILTVTAKSISTEGIDTILFVDDLY